MRSRGNGRVAIAIEVYGSQWILRIREKILESHSPSHPSPLTWFSGSVSHASVSYSAMDALLPCCPAAMGARPPPAQPRGSKTMHQRGHPRRGSLGAGGTARDQPRCTPPLDHWQPGCCWPCLSLVGHLHGGGSAGADPGQDPHMLALLLMFALFHCCFPFHVEIESAENLWGFRKRSTV